MTVTAYQDGEQQQETAQSNVALGDVSQVRPIPRITIQAFCETDAIQRRKTWKPRELAKNRVKVPAATLAVSTTW